MRSIESIEVVLIHAITAHAKASDQHVTKEYVQLHLEIGIEAMTEIGEKGEAIKHFRY